MAGAPSGSWLDGTELVRQGAEARIFRTEYLGRSALIKERFSKGYRHPELDRRIRHRRTLAEVRAITKCRKQGLDAPVIFHVDFKRYAIVMEEIKGLTVRDTLFKLESQPDDTQAAKLMKHIGTSTAKFHNCGMIHGDLTTSNFIVRDSGELVMIDFGLSFISKDIEDLAVDLYVLERAFLSTHPRSEELFKKVLNAYHATCRVASKVLNKLNDDELVDERETWWDSAATGTTLRYAYSCATSIPSQRTYVVRHVHDTYTYGHEGHEQRVIVAEKQKQK
eukprot:CAMPEP_0170167896 /NCGR_PEP_ID=MMETSP0040_2-20121228/1154_1 /TAXON_ID=641309 /ORGANISM="Lotharella oceanica, Strain CCMP622" /LENGTH=278 /DNA_ID=CAMNT_0010406043 /DNA_START=8 /DNA_END=842 /DNA_ORIENTATION=+